MSDTPFMPLWVADFVGDTLELDAKEVGAYMLILMAMWGRDGTLPNDQKKLQRVARCGRDWPKVWAAIGHYFTVEGDTISQGRLTRELQKVAAKREVNAQSGARGGRAKALKEKERALANATISLQQPEPYLEREETNVSSMPRKRVTKTGTRLPETWTLPKTWGEWAVDGGWPETVIRSEADKFRDYWIGKSGKDATKADWFATWRNWMRNSKAPKVVNGDGYDRNSKSAQKLHAFIAGAD
jgi:uncharacterized protein YdaU (DUF1376 family)